MKKPKRIIGTNRVKEVMKEKDIRSNEMLLDLNMSSATLVSARNCGIVSRGTARAISDYLETSQTELFEVVDYKKRVDNLLKK